MAAATIASGALPTAVAPAGGQGLGAAASTTLFLPAVAARPWAREEVCATGLPCGAEPGWTLACGGAGRIEDLLVGAPAAQSGVLAVGDGAAVFDPTTSAWRVQFGHDLSGLRGLYVAGDRYGWAVGERGRIARLDASSGCWATEGPEVQLNGRIVLEAVMTDDAGARGWAVGRREGVGQLLWMHELEGTPVWRDLSGWVPGLPGLTDIQLLRSDPDGTQQAWLVAPDAGRVLVAGLDGPATVRIDRQVSILDHEGAPAEPREVAMRAGRRDEGWLFGTSAGGELVGWRHLDPDGWQPAYRAERALVDLYFDGLAGGSWWLGLGPTDRRSSVLQTADRADGEALWSSVDTRSPSLSGGDDGSRAVASLGSGDALYAWGDDVWRYRATDDTWFRVRRRRALTDICAAGAGAAWLLHRALPWDGAQDGAGRGADAGTQTGADAGSQDDAANLLHLAHGLLRADGDVATAAAGTRLRALARGPGGSWAVGEDGVLLHLPSAAARWRTVIAPSAGGPDLVGVAAAADGAVWAVGTEQNGTTGVVVQLDAARAAWSPRAELAGRPVLAVAALPGTAWAVGRGVACDCPVGEGCTCELDPPFARRGREMISLTLDSVAAAAAPGGPVVWAAGEYYVVRREPGGWSSTTSARRLAGVPEGARIVDLAMGGSDDVWVLAGCQPYAADGRGVSLVMRFDGSAELEGETQSSREVLSMGLPLAALSLEGSAGSRTAWLAGDWSTVLRYDYPAGPAPPPASALAPDLRCVASLADEPR